MSVAKMSKCYENRDSWRKVDNQDCLNPKKVWLKGT